MLEEDSPKAPTAAADKENLANSAFVTAEAADEESFDLKDMSTSTDARSRSDTANSVDAAKFLHAAPAATNSGYVNNWNLANVEGTVARQAAAAKEKKVEHSGSKASSDRKHASSRSLAEDRTAIALLSAAW